MRYKFHKVYIELTNVCGLSCTFCPTKDTKSRTMDLKFYEDILKQLPIYTKDIAFHIFGDPLTLSNLEKYLDIAHKYNLNVHITTTGYYLKNFDSNLFFHKAIKQINFSLNSYNKNEMQISLEDYLKPIFNLCDLKLKHKVHNFINFRLWNIDNENSEESFNQRIFTILSKKFNIHLTNIDYKKPIRLENQILLNFDNYFKWPNLSDETSSNGYCHGLISQIGILSSGIVVPCCLDSFGIINLGDLKTTNLENILNSTKALNIVNGFKNNIAYEDLCKKCTYKNRFIKN